MNKKNINKKVMNKVEEFIDHHSIQLLKYLDGKAPASKKDPQPLEYVDTVLDEWSKLFGGQSLPEPCLKERTFWFTLYQYEELVELPAGEPLCLYEELMWKNLGVAKELLRSGSDLPAEFFATRPGEGPCAF